MRIVFYNIRDLYNNLNALEFFNTAYYVNQENDFLFNQGLALEQLYQFDHAIKKFEALNNKDSNDYNVLKHLAINYYCCGYFEKSIIYCNEYMKLINPSEIDLICEIYSMLADCYYNLGEIDQYIESLESVISISKDPKLIEFTKNNLMRILEYKELL